jgi:hypothetical protein
VVTASAPAEVVAALMAAIAEGRVSDALGLVDPQVVLMPVARPARRMYAGYEGAALLVDDLHMVYGRYRLDVKEIVAEAGGHPGEAVVTARVRVVQQTGDGEVWGPPVLAEFTVRGGLVAFLRSRHEG